MTNLDGYQLLIDAYAAAVTDNPNVQDIAGAWVPSHLLEDDDLKVAAAEAAAAEGESTRGLLEMCLEFLEDDPIWQQLEEAAGRALRAFAEEMDREADQIERYRQADDDEDEEE